MEEGSHKTGKWGQTLEARKSPKWILLLSPKETQPGWDLDFSPVRPFQGL